MNLFGLPDHLRRLSATVRRCPATGTQQCLFGSVIYGAHTWGRARGGGGVMVKAEQPLWGSHPCFVVTHLTRTDRYLYDPGCTVHTGTWRTASRTTSSWISLPIVHPVTVAGPTRSGLPITHKYSLTSYSGYC